MRTSLRNCRLHLMVVGAVMVIQGLVTLLSFGALFPRWALRAQGWYLDAVTRDDEAASK